METTLDLFFVLLMPRFNLISPQLDSLFALVRHHRYPHPPPPFRALGNVCTIQLDMQCPDKYVNRLEAFYSKEGRQQLLLNLGCVSPYLMLLMATVVDCCPCRRAAFRSVLDAPHCNTCSPLPSNDSATV